MVVEGWNFSSFKLHTQFYPSLISAFCILRITGLFTPDLTNPADKPLTGKRMLEWEGIWSQNCNTGWYYWNEICQSPAQLIVTQAVFKESAVRALNVILICSSCRLIWKITEMSRDLRDWLWTSIAFQGAQPQYSKKHSGELGSWTHQREMGRERNKNVMLREGPGQLSMPPCSAVSTWAQRRVLNTFGRSSSSSLWGLEDRKGHVCYIVERSHGGHSI